MEEELSEHELEERMYSTLHYVDDTQANRTDCSDAREDVQIVIIPRSNVRRYWRTSGDQNSQYRKVNPPQNTTLNNTEKLQQKPKPLEANQLKSNPQNSNQSTSKQVNQPAKEETSNSSNEASDLSIFQQPVSNNLKKTIEILDIDDDCRVVDIQSSDEDEVIEVLLPPKPTITIESSDDEVCPVVIESPSKENNFKNTTESKVLREVSSSPVPSVVSSVSDEFIRGDCIALNISSRHNNNQSFDFSLHGTDLLGQTPSKKKKKKNKNTATSTPISNQVVITNNNSGDTCFATPKSKAKKKKKKSKAQKNILNNDYYDSDSNLSLINSNKRSYTVTEKSLPSADVYESDSNQSEQNNVQKMQHQEIMGTQIESSDSSVTDKPEEVNTIPSTNNADDIMIVNDSALVDLTAPEPEINENIIMANVTGFPEDDSDNNDYTVVDNATKLGSTKIPAILCEDLDFDNLKGKEQVFKRRRYSLTTLRAEMEKFYNESWGGENFNHREIQKNMSRDKSLWVIDPKDKMPSMTKRKATCNYCNRIGHRDDACKWKPPVCFMCGSEGHYEPRCPKKICVNCGSPNHIYSNICRNCCNWHNMNCNECGQNGHPASHCPDVWRRYHNTIDVTLKLEQNLQTKKYYQHFCSGCTRRGHLVHACRNTLPFSGLPINSPYVFSYNPIYTNMSNENTNPNKNRIIQPDTTVTSLSPSTRMDRNKRQSKSPVVHETHMNKKRHMSESGDAGRNTKSPLNANKNVPLSQVDTTKCTDTNKSSITKEMVEGDKNAIIEAAPDYIPLNKSPNHNEKGQMIQDNEVSDTSEVITSARIYLTKEIKEALNTDEGRNWLNDAKDRNKITFTVDGNSGNSLFLSIIGSVGNQEAFQSELREWAKSKNLNQSDMDANKNKSLQQQLCDQMPRKRITLLRKVTEALESLNRNIGDPNALFKELKYLQNRHGQLLKTKVVSTQQLDNNRDNMKRMMRKLNMILLGQAGLAGGMEHLNELCELQRRLTNLRQNTVTKSLRDEIGCHYHYIFSGFPREDYADLVNKYYIGRNNTLTYKKRNDKVFKISPKPQKKTVNVVQRSNDILDVECTDKTEPKTRKLQKTINKLVFYHRRLVNSLPADSTSKKTRHFLMQKLHGNITRLGTLTKISTTAVKKLQRIQDMAQMFLSNV